MLWTKSELELKIKENKVTSDDLDEIVKDCQDAQKYRQLKEKMKQIEEESYLFDRLEACDTSGAAEVLRSFLSSKESE